MAGRVTSMQGRPLRNEAALRRVRKLWSQGGVIWVPSCEERCAMLGISAADFSHVVRFGDVTESRPGQHGFSYLVSGQSVDEEALGFWVRVAGHLLVVEVVTQRSITEE